MRFFPLFLSIGFIFMSSCGSDNESANSLETEVLGEGSTFLASDSSALKPNLNKEWISPDSIVPIPKEQLAGLTGFKKDSLLMRIKFQEEVNAMNRVFKNSDFNAFVKFMHPAIVKKQGESSLIADLKEDRKRHPMNFKSIVSGPLLDVADVIDEKGNSSGWYCLLPHQTTILQDGQDMRADGYLVGYSPDMKKCYFVDITRIPDEKVFYLMPDLKYIYERLPKRDLIP